MTRGNITPKNALSTATTLGKVSKRQPNVQQKKEQANKTATPALFRLLVGATPSQQQIPPLVVQQALKAIDIACKAKKAKEEKNKTTERLAVAWETRTTVLEGQHRSIVKAANECVKAAFDRVLNAKQMALMYRSQIEQQIYHFMCPWYMVCMYTPDMAGFN